MLLYGINVSRDVPHGGPYCSVPTTDNCFDKGMDVVSHTRYASGLLDSTGSES